MQDNDNWTDSHSDGDAAHASIRILSPGSAIGERYEVHDVLGVGGYGVVYAAFDRHLRRKVALKVLRHDRLSDGAIQRFRREVAIARDVHSPHLVRVFDIAQAEESTYLTMELVDGESLAAVVARGTLSIEQVIEIVRQVLEALQALHRVGIVHRDVKPSNVMLARDGQVKLTDFGLARKIDSETRATETATVVGTLEYLSPEQAMGLDIDARSDLYSLGILLFECLTGDVPLRGGSSLGTAIAHISKSAPNVRTIRADTPRWLAALAGRLLRKDRGQRYQSASEVLRDLRRRKAPAKTIRRDRLLVGALIVAMLGAIGFGYREVAERRFARLEPAGLNGASAVNRRGEVLWSDSQLAVDMNATAFVESPNGPTRIAAIRFERGNFDLKLTHRLEILDSATGQRVDSLDLPQLGVYFPGFSNTFGPHAMLATDVNHDGAQELIVTIAHEPYFPSYTLLVDPRLRKVFPLLIASGHHRALGTIDIDGDGTDEVIFTGIANRLGWYDAIAAVRVKTSGDRSYGASTPDEEYTESSSRALIWYALVGDGGVREGTRRRIDHARRRIVFEYADGTVEELGLDGFIAGTSSSKEMSSQRAAARTRSYDALRASQRLVRAGFAESAIEQAERAVAEADRANDRPLGAWARRVLIRVRIAGGAGSDEIEPLLEQLRVSFGSPSDAWWEAGRAFHLRGNTRDAIRWYREGLSIRAQHPGGRMVWEFVEGVIFALAEEGKWDEARHAIDAYSRAYRVAVAPYDRWLNWRATGAFTEPIPLVPQSIDVLRYVVLESDAYFTRDPDEVALRINENMKNLSDPYTILATSLLASINVNRGQLDEALGQAREAFEQIRIRLDDDTAARAHFTLVAERYARIARQAGKTDEAEVAEKAAREFRAR